MFIEDVDVYYQLDLIQPCVDPALELSEHGESGKTYIMGVDFAKQRDEKVVIMSPLLRTACEDMLGQR